MPTEGGEARPPHESAARVFIDVALTAPSGPETLAAVAAASLAVEARLAVVGDESELTDALAGLAHDAERLVVLHAPGCDGAASAEAAAANALQMACLWARASDGSQVTTASSRLVRRAAAETLVRLPGVAQPALAAVCPTLRHRGDREDPFALLLDVGASLEASAADLVAFALLGAAYARRISANARPRIALLSRHGGLEEAPERVVAAQALLERARGEFELLPPISADRVSAGDADVVVCDGLSGNILLRGLEGAVHSAEALLARAAERFRWRLGMSMLGSGISRLREVADWESYGGAPLLGYETLLIRTARGHGPRPIVNAVRLAMKAHRLDLVRELRAAVAP
jgi:glycerol-3-phosphate acyltransferase PlsX